MVWFFVASNTSTSGGEMSIFFENTVDKDVAAAPIIWFIAS